MKKLSKKLSAILLIVALVLAISVPVIAATVSDDTAAADGVTEVTEVNENNAADPTSSKAISAAIVIALASAAGAIGMSLAISKSAESISRQPEAQGAIRTSLMLGLVFIETAIIYALIVAILIIFVL